uniref:Uncharacterized protein n=1 Tax=Meloidogyne floridensis TaxID=298350 RepID=A0A915NCM0_9BILA
MSNFVGIREEDYLDLSANCSSRLDFMSNDIWDGLFSPSNGQQPQTSSYSLSDVFREQVAVEEFDGNFNKSTGREAKKQSPQSVSDAGSEQQQQFASVSNEHFSGEMSNFVGSREEDYLDLSANCSSRLDFMSNDIWDGLFSPSNGQPLQTSSYSLSDVFREQVAVEEFDGNFIKSTGSQAKKQSPQSVSDAVIEQQQQFASVSNEFKE